MKTNEQFINKQREIINNLNNENNQLRGERFILNNAILKLINNEIDLNQLQEYYNKIKNVIDNKPENETEQLNQISQEINNKYAYGFILFLIDLNNNNLVNFI